jgi:hypothetical protein
MSPPAVEVRAPTPEDLAWLAEHLRDQDLAELQAAGWDDPHQALIASVARSKQTFLAVADGLPAALFGCAEYGSLLAPVGVPWMLGTDAVARHRRVLQRWARRYIEAMLQEYPRLFNAVHAENTVSVRWLQALGFTLHPATPAPPHGAPFRVFEMSRHV